MKFGTFLLRVDGSRDAEIDDLRDVVAKGLKTYRPSMQKYLYLIESEIIEERFFWMSCEYDDASSFRDYVINQETFQKEPNPRTKSQIEPRQQFFACYDVITHHLYFNDVYKRKFLQSYLSDAAQREYIINNVYTSVDEFCNHIKYIRGFRYVQVDDLCARTGDIFQQTANLWGQDLPTKIQMKVSYGDIPVHNGRSIIDRLHRDKLQFKNVIVIGCDDNGVEQAFDFNSVIKRIEIAPIKDENERYDPKEVQRLLVTELRK